jgi:hypothetical protein
MAQGSYFKMGLVKSNLIFFMYSLSEQLRTRAKAYFSRKFKREVQDDEAEQYLLSLAHLYDLFITKE